MKVNALLHQIVYNHRLDYNKALGRTSPAVKIWTTAVQEVKALKKDFNACSLKGRVVQIQTVLL